MRVRFGDSLLSRKFTLAVDGRRMISRQVSATDTLVIADSLFPLHTYNVRAYLIEDGLAGDSSNVIQITTMDTTSHQFTWQVDTLGDGASSVLYDVAIINDTLAYAVGEMYLRDTLGYFDPNAFNIAKWNGIRWQLKRLPFIGPCSAERVLGQLVDKFAKHPFSRKDVESLLTGLANLSTSWPTKPCISLAASAVCCGPWVEA